MNSLLQTRTGHIHVGCAVERDYCRPIGPERLVQSATFYLFHARFLVLLLFFAHKTILTFRNHKARTELTSP